MATNIADTRNALNVEERARKEPGLPNALAAVLVIIAIMAVLSLLIFGLMYVISYGPTRAPAATGSVIPENVSPVTSESVSPAVPPGTAPRSGNP